MKAEGQEALLDANKAGILVGGVVDDALPQLCIDMAAIMLCPHLQEYQTGRTSERRTSSLQGFSASINFQET